MDGLGTEVKENAVASSSPQLQDGTSPPVTSSGHNIETPPITLPKVNGFIQVTGEKFAPNPVTGTDSMTVLIAPVLTRHDVSNVFF